MSHQVHYVVYYDTDTKVFEVDYEFTSDLAERHNGMIYNTETEKWEDFGWESPAIAAAEYALRNLLLGQ